MDKKPVTADTVKPTNSEKPSLPEAIVVISLNFNATAPKIMGAEIRNENRAAASRLNLRPMPPAIVTPERDTPGIMAIACEIPMTNESKKLTVLKLLVFHENLSIR
jgi:hypothetical protein